VALRASRKPSVLPGRLLPLRTRRLILTRNCPSPAGATSPATKLAAAATIDRSVHRAEAITLKGSSHRLRNTGIDTLPSTRAENTAN